MVKRLAIVLIVVTSLAALFVLAVPPAPGTSRPKRDGRRMPPLDAPVGPLAVEAIRDFGVNFRGPEQMERGGAIPWPQPYTAVVRVAAPPSPRRVYMLLDWLYEREPENGVLAVLRFTGKDGAQWAKRYEWAPQPSPTGRGKPVFTVSYSREGDLYYEGSLQVARRADVPFEWVRKVAAGSEQPATETAGDTADPPYPLRPAKVGEEVRSAGYSSRMESVVEKPSDAPPMGARAEDDKLRAGRGLHYVDVTFRIARTGKGSIDPQVLSNGATYVNVPHQGISASSRELPAETATSATVTFEYPVPNGEPHMTLTAPFLGATFQLR